MIPFEQSSRGEWLETNGIGGFASGTIAGMNTRRYHGLLVAATRPPVGRMVLLSKLEETLVWNGRRVELSTNRYPGVVHPQGHLYLKEFRRDPFPVFVYEVDGIRLQKSVFMVHGENTAVVRYEASGDCVLEVRPLLAFRDYHSTTHENGAIRGTPRIEPGMVVCSPYDGCPDLYLGHDAAEVRITGAWYRNFEYTIEEERGLDFREDLYHPAALTFDLRGSGATLIASTQRRDASEAPELQSAEIRRRQQVLSTAPPDKFTQALASAADQFIVRRGNKSSVIAGYHWFSDWGRDTMIALPGLTLATGRYDDARKILLAFAASADQGMLPNRFPDAGETPEYNTVDATLWYFEAVRAFAAYTGDDEFVRRDLYPVLADIIGWHERGTRFGIRMDADGLLLAGEPGVQLTWMDAKIGDWVVTPRYGKPVEIQALWYNALKVMEELAGRFGCPERSHYAEVADRARRSFVPLFWNEDAGCLYDVVSRETKDAAIRPNQILAVSLFHSMLPRVQARAVVDYVQQHLLTPYGLRSLSPADPQYRPRYEGDSHSRDSAYHQGTVWPWLLGQFLTAYLKVNGRSAKARRQATQWLEPLRDYLVTDGGGQIPEVFDGDAPHRAGGCFAQAWSVAELLRVVTEDLSSSQPVRRMVAQATQG